MKPRKRLATRPDEISVSAHTLLHQLRNVLQPLQSHVQILNSRQPDHSPLLTHIQSDLDYIERFVSRASSLTRELEPELAPVKIHSLLSSVVHELGARFSGIQISVDADETTWPLDECLFRIALVELITNAVEATVDCTERHIALKCRKKDDTLELSIHDNGNRLTEEIRARLFSPFFTTKGISGAGLGLPLALKIVGAHGGTLNVGSDKKTTCARISLRPVAC